MGVGVFHFQVWGLFFLTVFCVAWQSLFLSLSELKSTPPHTNSKVPQAKASTMGFPWAPAAGRAGTGACSPPAGLVLLPGLLHGAGALEPGAHAGAPTSEL